MMLDWVLLTKLPCVESTVDTNDAKKEISISLKAVMYVLDLLPITHQKCYHLYLPYNGLSSNFHKFYKWPHES